MTPVQQFTTSRDEVAVEIEQLQVEKALLFASLEGHEYGEIRPLLDEIEMAMIEIKTTILTAVFASMKGRVFGIDFVKMDGTPRTCLGQVEGIYPDRVVIREINCTRRLRESGHPNARAYRTVMLPNVKMIRVSGADLSFSI